MPPVVKREFSDAFVRELKPGPEDDYREQVSPLRIKVRPTSVSYVVWTRWGGKPHPATRTIGKVGVVKLADARETAREWGRLSKAGLDPVVVAAEARAAAEAEEAKQRKAEAAKSALAFDTLLDEYAKHHLSTKRRGWKVERELRAAFLPQWAGRPVTEITRADVVEAVDKIVARGCRYGAKGALSALKTMLSWAAERHDIPQRLATERMKLARIVGPTPPRDRMLSDAELFAFWRACPRLPGPHGTVYRLLALTAARHSEILGLRWREIDLKKARAVIPPARFKSGVEHHIPLTPHALALLEDAPHWTGGDHLFSSDGGRTSLRMSAYAKLDLDKRMLLTLKAMAKSRGDDPAQVELPGWKLHDLRRTVRANLSALRVPDHVCEMVLGHGRRGIERVYDTYRYEPEIREALEAWGRRLRSIVDPQAPEPTSNVIDLERARRA